MKKHVLMIHEVGEWLFDLPLQSYILTFDDGLYTQYLYFERITKIDTDKFFFISTKIVADTTTTQSPEYITCDKAHEKYRLSGDRSHYMNWEQIKEIEMTPRCIIGGHSHEHMRTPTSAQLVRDTNKMIEQFNIHDIKPTSFCFPYNKEHNMYRAMLQAKGFNEFYGEERIDINEIRYKKASRTDKNNA